MRQKHKYHYLSLDEKERLFRWFKSQQAWHAKQPESEWHKRQAQWFKNNSRWIFTFGDMVSITIRKNTQALAKSIQDYNALYSRILEKHPETAEVLFSMRKDR